MSARRDVRGRLQDGSSEAAGPRDVVERRERRAVASLIVVVEDRQAFAVEVPRAVERRRVRGAQRHRRRRAAARARRVEAE